MNQAQKSIAVSVQLRTIGIQIGSSYSIIEDMIQSSQTIAKFRYSRHESGPEIIFHIALATAVITLAKGIVELLTSLTNLITQRIREGSEKSQGLELVIRFPANSWSTDSVDTLPESHRNSLDSFGGDRLPHESRQLPIDYPLTHDQMRQILQEALAAMLAKQPPNATVAPPSKTTILTPLKKLKKSTSSKKKRNSLSARRRKK